MVIAWAMGGIYVGQRLFDPTIADVALDGCIGLLIVAGFTVVAVAIEPLRRRDVPLASREYLLDLDAATTRS
jgi:hypothetical protein